jgi:hypothetical protein
MKLRDLHESIDFQAYAVENRDGKTYYTFHDPHEQTEECYACHGSKKDYYDEKNPCEVCKGAGTITQRVTSSPTLNASNANAQAIITDLLGMSFDHDGLITQDQLPEVRRRLIKALNSEKDRSRLHKDDVDHEQSFGVQGREGNVVRIGRQGPKVYEFGRTDEQVLRYARKMLDIVEYAMKHNLVVGWA